MVPSAVPHGSTTPKSHSSCSQLLQDGPLLSVLTPGFRTLSCFLYQVRPYRPNENSLDD